MLLRLSGFRTIRPKNWSRSLLRSHVPQQPLRYLSLDRHRTQVCTPYPPASRPLSTFASESSTIYALSTAPGRAAIAIIRCSGPACLEVYQLLCPNKPLPKPRQASLRTLFSPSRVDGERHVLDHGALILYFPAPTTVTGEDVLEFHIHGGPAVVKAVLGGISACVSASSLRDGSLRYAEPGEFTRRAFYNDRLDLTQVEALGDTLSADTEQQRRLAVRGASSTLNERYETWRSMLLDARGELEALIDFSEDQHFDDSPAEFTASVTEQVLKLQRRIQASIDNAAKGELLRGGISIALLGAPNAGKSSLLNQIVGREAAIVSREAGTTRDIVEVNVDINGYFCNFGDLAGLRTASAISNSAAGDHHLIGEVEREGMRRAKARALAADVVIVVLEVQRGPGAETDSESPLRIEAEVLEALAQCDMTHQRVLFAVNKMDLLSPALADPATSLTHLLRSQVPRELHKAPVCYISCVESGGTSTGIQTLLAGLSESFASLTAASSLEDGSSSSWDESLGASERQKLLLMQANDYLNDFLRSVQQSSSATREQDSEIDVVVAAESLRAAAQALGKITGRGESGDVEEVLGVVFEKFCVGK